MGSEIRGEFLNQVSFFFFFKYKSLLIYDLQSED